eukprot:gene1027-615_t
MRLLGWGRVGTLFLAATVAALETYFRGKTRQKKHPVIRDRTSAAETSPGFHFPSAVLLRFKMSKDAPYITTTGEAGARHKATVKSYKNEDFLGSGEGRLVRMMCEFEEPQQRLNREMIRSTVLFFGSARSKTAVQHQQTVVEHQKQLTQAVDPEERKKIQSALDQLEKTKWMCEWMEKVRELAKRVAEFSKSHKALIERTFKSLPDYFKVARHIDVEGRETPEFQDFVVTTGGGPGFMEAANSGAASVLGVKTMGMGISLPFETGVNPYVTDGLAFEFHYFFSRKFWMMYSCRAIIVAPGGVGTLDEMFELLTLRQTGKIPNLPVILLCSHFWRTVVNWQSLVDFGVVAQKDVDQLLITDSCDEAMEYIEAFYQKIAAEG